MLDLNNPASLLKAPYCDGFNLVVVTVWPSGACFWQAERGQKPRSGTYRGRVNGFSISSRRRLMEKLIQLDYSEGGWLFVTLTYPGTYVADAGRWKMDLDAFNTALRRDWDGVYRGAIWRLERQRRGAPHFHLLVSLSEVPRIGLVQTWVRETWTRLLGGPPKNADWVRTQVQQARPQAQGGIQKLLNYLAKYLGKSDEGEFIDVDTGEVLPPGRFWGEWGKLPYAPATVHYLNLSQLELVSGGIRLEWPDSRYLSSIDSSQLRGLIWGPGATFNELLRGLTWRSRETT